MTSTECAGLAENTFVVREAYFMKFRGLESYGALLCTLVIQVKACSD